MVYVITSVQIAPGKAEEAWEWAKELNKYAEKTFGGQGDVTRQVTPGPGQGGRITWIITYDSLSDWVAKLETRDKDPKWQEYRKTMQTLAVPSTFTSTVYKTA